jgi:hypothetical protein
MSVYLPNIPRNQITAVGLPVVLGFWVVLKRVKLLKANGTRSALFVVDNG